MIPIRHRVNLPTELQFNDMVEIDVRDYECVPCVSHDPITINGLFVTLETYLDTAKRKGTKLLAVNIKSTGNEERIVQLLDNSCIEYFLFDMSKPTYYKYSQYTNNIALPVNEYDTVASLAHYPEVKWVWVDCFNRNIDGQIKQIQKIQDVYSDARIVIVAPDLYGERSNNPKFNEIERFKYDKNVYICTKNPIDFLNQDKWTFGIITRGQRNSNIQRFIESVRRQGIKEYEILIVGDTKQVFSDVDVTQIPFSVNDDRGWITKKKNIICENAKYENIFVGHDDIELYDDWYSTLQREDNDWQVLNFTYMNDNDTRNFWERSLYQGMPYIGGSFIALKKSVFNRVKWDEKLFYAQKEDVDYSYRLLIEGFKWRNSSARIKLIDQILISI